VEFQLQVLNIVVVPVIAAYLAIGTAGRKIAWYAGAVALVFVADVAVHGVFMALRAMGNDPSHEAGVTRLVLLFVDTFLISAASNTAARCPACNARSHPKDTRCRKCLRYFA
jgi:hypothetical protein